MTKTKQINWTVKPEDRQVITEIAKRATALAAKHDGVYPMLEAQMDVTAAHANGMPLCLDRLLAADDFNFAHDVFGIRRHLNRQTGQLENFFVPRFASPERPVTRKRASSQAV